MRPASRFGGLLHRPMRRSLRGPFVLTDSAHVLEERQSVRDELDGASAPQKVDRDGPPERSTCIVHRAIYSAFHDGCTPGCTITTCSCTRPAPHWSSTSYDDTNAARVVNFTDGDTYALNKTFVDPVRAVRTLP
jgi:hypothetical protein